MSPPPKLTPTASPSGKLCKVIAATNSQMRRKRTSAIASGPRPRRSSGGTMALSCARNAPPINMATTTVADATQRLAPCASACSMPGMISEKKEAASMTPAAKPSIRFCCASVGRPIDRIGSAPTTVAKPARRLATKPVRTIESAIIRGFWWRRSLRPGPCPWP